MQVHFSKLPSIVLALAVPAAGSLLLGCGIGGVDDHPVGSTADAMTLDSTADATTSEDRRTVRLSDNPMLCVMSYQRCRDVIIKEQHDCMLREKDYQRCNDEADKKVPACFEWYLLCTEIFPETVHDEIPSDHFPHATAN